MDVNANPEDKPSEPILWEEREYDGLQKTLQDFSDRILPVLENPGRLAEQLPDLSGHADELIRLGTELRSAVDLLGGVDDLCRLMTLFYRSAAAKDRRTKAHEVYLSHLQSVKNATERLGIEVLGGNDLIGAPFDARWQHAVGTVLSSKKCPSGTVAEHRAFGARIAGRMIRPAHVVVATDSDCKGETL